jgi:hypothetical protein
MFGAVRSVLRVYNEIYGYVQRGQFHDHFNHCQLLSKRARSTVMLLTCIGKVCSSSFGRRTGSIDISRGFSLSLLEISPGHLLLYHAGSHWATCHRTFYDFRLFPASLYNSCGQYSALILCLWWGCKRSCGRLRLKCDGARAETRFRLFVERDESI